MNASSFHAHRRPSRPTGVDPLLPRLIADELVERGLSAAPAAQGLGFGLEDLRTPGFRLSHEPARQFVCRALELLGQPRAGLLLGSRLNPVALGDCLLGLLAAETPAAMLQFAARYAPCVKGFVELSCEAGADGTWLVAVPLHDDPPFNAFIVEHALASAVRVHAFVTGGEVAPLRVELSQPPPADPSLHERVLRCRPSFGRLHDRVLFPDAPRLLPTRDADVFASVELRLRARHAYDTRHSDLVSLVRQEIRRHRYAPATLASLAGALRLSERTLRRRLTEEDLSFAALLDQERRLRAMQLLRAGALRLDEIAAECGYSDTRSLRRAVARWTGRPPTQLLALPEDGSAVATHVAADVDANADAA